MSIVRLENALPALSALRFPRPVEIDWKKIEKMINLELPSDYKEISENYPIFSICDFLSIVRPAPRAESEFLELSASLLRYLQDNHDDGVAEYPPYPAEGGLFPWGNSNWGDVYYWKCGGRKTISIVTESRSGFYWEYNGSLAEFLAGWLSGDIQPEDQPTIEQIGPARVELAEN